MLRSVVWQPFTENLPFHGNLSVPSSRVKQFKKSALSVEPLKGGAIDCSETLVTNSSHKSENLNNIPHRRRKAHRRITHQIKEKKILAEENLYFQPRDDIFICLLIFV
jgi:methionine aminopeptidase